MAATRAGITQEADGIRLVSEAEAAAIFGLRVQAQDGTVGDEDCIIVCDCGGGTVDGESKMQDIEGDSSELHIYSYGCRR